MKHFIGFLIAAVTLAACQDVDPLTDFTGYETTYELVAASAHDVKGIVTFKERIDGFTTIVISLDGTSGSAKHPVHLHLGNITTQGADVAALLNPVTASSGKSETVLSNLADETAISYKDLVKLKACIKVHLSDSGPERDIVLSAGNVGQSYLEAIQNGTGKSNVAGCKGD